jgi:glycosyltransferase involved in cell wall biosynthesis
VRLVFVTQTIDADHPALAQTIDLVRTLAARFDSVVVLCGAVGRHDLPANVELRTFGASSRAGRGVGFARQARAALLTRRRPDAVLVHMVPLFLLLLAPIAKAARVPLLLWYTHWHAGRALRAATSLADVVLSVDRRSFPLATAKLVATGHAIDVERFAPAAADPTGGRLRLLSLGRLARWKGHETTLEGLRLAVSQGLDAELELRGPALTDDERAHRAELERAVAAAEELRDRVRIRPALPRDELPARLGRADALVSATQPHDSQTLDKVVYEAAACGVPVVASNPALEEFLGDLPLELSFPPRDAAALSRALLGLGEASPETRRRVGLELRQRVVSSHSVETWADAVAALVSARGRK